jgi:hypothetical protein
MFISYENDFMRKRGEAAVFFFFLSVCAAEKKTKKRARAERERERIEEKRRGLVEVR